MIQEPTTREELERKIKTNKDWLEYYFTVLKTGVLTFRFDNIASSVIIPPPEAKLVIPRTMKYEFETESEREERVEKETKKIKKKINKLMKTGKLTEEEANAEIKRLIDKIPFKPDVPVRKISKNGTRFKTVFYKIGIDFESAIKVSETKTGLHPHDSLKGVTEIFDLYGKMSENLISVIKKSESIGRISKEEADELISEIPDIKEYLKRVNFISNVKATLDFELKNRTRVIAEWNLNEENIKKILEKLEENPEFFNAENAENVKKEFDMLDTESARHICRWITYRLPSTYSIVCSEHITKIKNKICCFEEVDFEGAFDRKNPSPFTEFTTDALADLPVKSVTIPTNIKKAGSWSFYNTNIENFSVGRKFKNGKSLESDFKLTERSVYLFYLCKNLKKLELGNQTTFYPTCFCSDCKNLTEHNYSKALTVIENYAFSGCSKFSNSNFPKHLAKIGIESFANCNFSGEIKFPDSLKHIGAGAFKNNNIQKISLGKTETGVEAFAYNKNLEIVEYRDGAEIVAMHSFKGCDNLKEIIVPSSVEQILFDSRYNIESDFLKTAKLVFYGTPKQFLNISTRVSPYDSTIYLKDFNKIEDVENGKIRLYMDNKIPFTKIEFVNRLPELEKIIADSYKNYLLKEIKEPEDKDGLISTLLDVVKEIDDYDFVCSVIDKNSDTRDLNTALTAANIKTELNSKFTDYEIDKIMERER